MQRGRGWISNPRRGIITPVRYNDFVHRISFVAALLLAACAPAVPSSVPPAPILHPYSTVTPAPTSDLTTGLVVSAETPLPTSTPSVYTIKSGDTLSQIAERLHISVDSLLLANPGLDPNALRVGETLLIPGSAGNVELATPTPAPVKILEVACRPMSTGAAWCFALVHNDSVEPLENVTGQISILDSTGSVLASQEAALLLDVLPAGVSLPLAIPFSGPLPLDLHPQIRILTAMPISTETPRYLPAYTRDTLTQVSWSGRTADVSGEVVIPAGAKDAAEVWLGAVAYDRSGRVLGWRRWESPGGIRAGESLPFQLWVYSLAGAIDRVELTAQARP